MRDILVTLIVFGSLPVILARPWIGVLMWSWLGYMNPHRLSWSFAFDFPFAQVVAIATLLGFLFTTDRRFCWNTTTIAWVLFCVWFTITTVFALDQEGGWQGWDRMIKVQLFAFLTVILIHGRERIMALVWVVALSLGFFGLKGGLFVFRTSGEHLVWGPPGSFIEDNNALALALIMTVPLLWFLVLESKQRWLRWLLGGMIVLTCAAVLGSNSRGAALAGAGMVGLMWLKSSHRLRLGVAMLAVLPMLLYFMPSTYFDRLETIASYEEDNSAMGRIRAWQVAMQIAAQRPIGGGFNSIIEENYRRYAPEVAREVDEKAPGHFSEAHSIYFKVLGDHGIVGLILFLVIGISTYRAAGRLVTEHRDQPGTAWAAGLAAMIQVSLVGYAVGGAFLGLSYFDMFYCLVALVVGLQITLRDAPQPATEAAPDGEPAVAGHRELR
jgi:probable O-glycosylation ligase (exosortase A-associated)